MIPFSLLAPASDRLRLSRSTANGGRPLRGFSALRADRRGLVPRGAVPLLVIVASVGIPGTAGAHGGIAVAEGGGDGVRIAVQGSTAGAGEVDLATTLTGRGSGRGSRVVYWIRPEGRRRSIRVATQRDEGGIHHAEIPLAGRGAWQDWDVAAYVTLSTGRQLRVTNDRRDPPGPPVRGEARRNAAPPSAATTTSGTVPTPAEPPSTGAAVQDVSGEGDGAPSWVLPSIALLVIAGVIAVVLRHRRLPAEDED
jgi:hypothetical protein